MAGSWRVTMRMVATAVAASAVSRAAESVRRLIAEAAPPQQLQAPAAPTFLEPPAHLTATAPTPLVASGEDRVIAAQQVRPPHEYGPTPVIVPSHGIGFRSEPRRREPVAEMPVISRPAGEEPEGRDTVAPAEPVIMPKSVRTAAAIVQELEDEPQVDDGVQPSEDAPPPEEPEAEPVAEEPEAEPVAEEPEDGPVAEPEPVRALHLTAPPVEETVIDPEPVDDELSEPVEPPPAAEPVAEEPAKAKDKKAERRPDKKDKSKDKGKHRRHTSAVSGTVQSSRGRGLRGMQVTVLDDKERPVATAVSGSGGAFVVEELPAGTYRLTATDEDGDFAPGWHGGSSFAKADTIKVKEGKTRRKIGVTLVSAAAIDLDVDVRKNKAVVEVTVTDRATGTPAVGSVRISTKLLSAELPLTKGHSAITLLGSANGSPRLSKKVTVDYSGSKHTRPESAKGKLR